jgi:4-hydroxy-3-methylbut-2-enyl diphosphate reductase
VESRAWKGNVVEIKRAKEMGFCFGVRRAITLMEQAARTHGTIESLGAIVHNQQVVAHLASLGVNVVDSLADLKGPTVATTSHGVGPKVLEGIESRGLHRIDTTCPFVRKAQQHARSLASEGFTVVIFGDAEHPEVKGVLEWAGDLGLATQEPPDFHHKPPRKLGLLSQTTQSPARFAEFTRNILEANPDGLSEVRIFNTICHATNQRQAAALELARDVDVMIVVGGKNSANTRRLAHLCAETSVETHHIETEAELNHAWFRGKRSAGVTAGASTPDQVIDAVVRVLQHMNP